MPKTRNKNVRKKAPQPVFMPAQNVDDGWDSPLFGEGMDVGISFGRNTAYEEAKRFYDEGRIEAWFEAMRPKSAEEWAEWEAENGKITDFLGIKKETPDAE